MAEAEDNEVQNRGAVYEYSIGSELQPGVVSFRQRPSSTKLEMWGLKSSDDYDSWSVTMPSTGAEAYSASQLAIGDNRQNNKMV